MKLVIKIILSFTLLAIVEYGYAQGTNTEVITRLTISSSNFYLDGKLLNNIGTELTLNRVNNFSIFNVNEKYSFESIGTDINTNLFYKNKYRTFINKTNINYFNKKDFNNIKFDFTNENEEEFFYDKPIFKIMLGSFVALGAATAYFKIKADKRFDNYKKTNNTSLLDDTNKYDAISGVTFALMQVNLGVLVYYFLRD
ncbi:MAG: hypothetical protein IIA48_04670 [Bacteroidetes bacterium]|nr:hypothetical protein [Bacteroidota bacterium]